MNRGLQSRISPLYSPQQQANGSQMQQQQVQVQLKIFLELVGRTAIKLKETH